MTDRVGTAQGHSPGAVHCLTCPLRPLCLPGPLDEEDVHRFDAIVHREGVVPAGVDVVVPGEPLRSVHILRVGLLQEFVRTSPGQRRTVGYSLPSDIIGLDGFATGVHVTGARSRDTVAICEVPRNDLVRLGGLLPELLDQALVAAGQRLVASQRMQLVLSRHTAPERVAALMMSHAERAERLRWSTTHLRLPLSHAEIAEALGIAPAALSRTLRSLAEENILRVERSEVEILDPARLRELADGPLQHQRHPRH